MAKAQPQASGAEYSAFLQKQSEMLQKLSVEPEIHAIAVGHQLGERSFVERHGSAGWQLRRIRDGQVPSVQRFLSLDDLLYQLARDIVARESGRRSPNSSQTGLDPRRFDFARQLDLIGRVSAEWKSKLAEEFAGRLVRHPFRDSVSNARPEKHPSEDDMKYMP